MIARCTDPNVKNWKNYGGRGIQLCERWRNSFAAFLSDMGKKPSPSLSIDRINNDGNYEPGNCRWATPIEQSNNKRARTGAAENLQRMWEARKRMPRKHVGPLTIEGRFFSRHLRCAQVEEKILELAEKAKIAL
jgi:hypothetical protein